jgi:ribosomal protein S18 acetylase RimI-like enzyme
LETHRIHFATDPAFAALLEIYRDAIPQSERKSNELLAAMLQRPEYLFLVGIHETAVVGFSITFCFTGFDACLLEYMAVDTRFRGQGIGRYLFTEVTKRSEVSNRFLLAEVDSDRTNAAQLRDAAAKRKAFYRTIGYREIEGLRYIMPPVASTEPPEMNLLAYKADLPRSINKTHLRTWLQCTYGEVYGLLASDHRIEQMLHNLPQNISLT